MNHPEIIEVGKGTVFFFRFESERKPCAFEDDKSLSIPHMMSLEIFGRSV